jgi:hypothetical protein
MEPEGIEPSPRQVGSRPGEPIWPLENKRVAFLNVTLSHLLYKFKFTVSVLSENTFLLV